MLEEQRLIDELLKRLAAVEAENQRLKFENAELRRRLEKNSQNSHKPPSSDGYRKKSVRPACRSKKSEHRAANRGTKGKPYVQ